MLSMLQSAVRIPPGIGIAVAILLGFALGEVLKPQHLDAVMPVGLFLMLYPMMLEMNAHAVARVVARPGPVLAALFLNFLVSPLLISGLLRLVVGDCEKSLVIGITLYGTVPCGGMAPAFTGMLGGNVSLAVAITTISLFLSLGIVPLWTEFLIGLQVAVPASLIFRSLCFIIAIPFIAALMTRWIILKTKGESTFSLVAQRLKVLSSLGPCSCCQSWSQGLVGLITKRPWRSNLAQQPKTTRWRWHWLSQRLGGRRPW
jgi:ACR3 family arsenite efflux pump ArsB